MNPLDAFDIKFTGNRRRGLKVNPIPGNFFEVITIRNLGTRITIPEVVVGVTIPLEQDFLGVGKEAFTLQSKSSVKVYLNGEDVSPKWEFIDLASLNTEQMLAPGDTIEIYIHYEYAFKGQRYDYSDIFTWLGEDYTFITDLSSAYGSTWSNILSAIPIPL